MALVPTVSVVNAQTSENNADSNVAELEFIDVIGHKDNDIDNTLNNVDIVQLSDLRDPSVVDIRSAFKYSPVIEVAGGTTEQIRIRGFGKNYTEMTIDGEPTTEFVAFGRNAFGGKNIVEIDTLKQIDIVIRSPFSQTKRRCSGWYGQYADLFAQ